MKKREGLHTVIHQADGVLYTVDNVKEKILIVLSGSEGGLEHAEKVCWFLQDNGIASFALGYFKTKHSPKHLDQIEVENFKHTIDYLRQLGYQKIGVLAASKGAEYALAAAITYQEITCLILRTPSYFYSEGMINKTPSHSSCWSYEGKQLPYTPYKTRKLPVLKEMLKHKEYNILAINENKTINLDSIIPIEKVNGPILMFSTSLDTVWPSYDSCIQLEKRLIENDFSYPHEHVNYKHMSHMMLEYCGKQIQYFIQSERQYPKECAQERIHMGEKTVQWIKEVW